MTRGVVVGLAVILASGALDAGQALTRHEADRMHEKLALILERGELERGPSRGTVRTSFTEREVNAYLKFIASQELPPEMRDPAIGIADRGKLKGRTLVDLDRVRTAKERGWFDPLAYVTGTVEVTVAGTLQSGRGEGRFALESATLGGVPVPKSVVQDLLTYFTKTPEMPQGVDLDRPFALPANIREIHTRVGLATVVQ